MPANKYKVLSSNPSTTKNNNKNPQNNVEDILCDIVSLVAPSNNNGIVGKAQTVDSTTLFKQTTGHESFCTYFPLHTF
jgi:hypothetical protein